MHITSCLFLNNDILKYERMWAIFYKNRNKSIELLILSYLEKRMNLERNDRYHYSNLQKGYEGEQLFDLMTKKLECNCYILNDLLLKVNNTTFQIDSIIITAETIYLYEVKNHKGDYYYEPDKFFKKPNTEIINPLHQLERCRSLLRQLLHKHGFNLPINASVIFINPAFTLYQASLNKPIIFPTQIKQHLNKLNAIPTTLNQNTQRLAEKLISLHIDDSHFTQLPSYDYDQLRKGINCGKCNSFSINVQASNCVCNECGYKELVATAVMRSVKEFRLLFPEQKITTNRIHEWCQVVHQKKKIRMILGSSFQMMGTGRWAYYE